MAKPRDRSDFPGCGSCRYAQHGPWHVCVACAGETLQSIRNPCPICSQQIDQGTCVNRLCTGRADQRHIERIEAIALHTDPLDRVIRRFKYEEKYGWALIFARLLIGHLNNRWWEDNVDLIIANPGSPGRGAQRRGDRQSRIAGRPRTSGRLTIPTPPLLTKSRGRRSRQARRSIRRETPRSSTLPPFGCSIPNASPGKRIILYDDICTTDLQLNAVAGRLRKEWGAVSVVGVVLARQPWGY